MKKYRVVFGVASVSIILALLGYLMVRGVHFDVLQPMGSIAKQQRDLLVFTLVLSAVVVIPVFTLLGIFAWNYREGRTGSKKRHRPDHKDNVWLEVAWWGIPIAIIAVLAVVTWVTSHSLDPYRKIESSKPAIEVQVVALQWKWLFIYPELGVATLNQLPVPVDTPIHFTLTADAPMSAFWVPTLGSQIYNMNGMSSQLNLIANHEGNFPGYTTNINGEGYAKMKFMVRSQSKAAFDAWVKRARKSKDMMDQAAYDKLAKPETITEEREYMLMQRGLYDWIVQKYMPEHATSEAPNSTHNTNGSNHDMHKMEGM